MADRQPHSFIKILAVLFLNSDGARFHAKYYTRHFPRSSYVTGGVDLTKFEDQRKYEKALLSKAKRMEVLSGMKPQDSKMCIELVQIFTYGRHVVLFKQINELQLYIVGDEDENEVLLSEFLECIQKVLSYITKQQLTASEIVQINQEIILILDEMIDQGIPVTLEPQLIYSRIKMKEVETPSPTVQTKPVPEQPKGAFSSLFGFAKSSLQKTLNLG